MDHDAFLKSMDRTRLDHLKGEILAFVSDFEAQGYHNMDIARMLVEAGFNRADRDITAGIPESFRQHVRDTCVRYLAEAEAFGEKVSRRIEREKWN
jgi:hypothetical protein